MQVNLIDNHDTQRFANEPGPSVSNDEIRQRLHLALAIAFSVPGIPQLYMGDELGVYGGNDPDNRRDMPAWAWSASDRATSMPPAAIPNAQLTFAFVQKLIALRLGHDALADGDYLELWRQNGGAANVLAFARSTATETLIFVANNGAAAATLTLPLQQRASDGATLDDLFAAGAPTGLVVAQGAVTLTLPPKSAGLYRAR
jgi:glycosidase